MLQTLIEAILSVIIPICELMGISVAAIAAGSAFLRYARALVTRRDDDVKFRLAQGLALSLEFKMASEILKTVLVRSIDELIVLGAVIFLRALLSFLIHFEMKQIDNHQISEKMEGTK